MGNSLPLVRSFCFVDGQQRVAGGSAVVVTPSAAQPGGATEDEDEDGEEVGWSDAQTAAFMAGDPLTLGWVTQSPEQRGSGRIYVCCWITIDDDYTSC
jgi:hypothetical protein